MSSAAISGHHHSGAGPLSLMSCVRESSPLDDYEPSPELEKNSGNKRKFWNPKKWFKRKNKISDDGASSGVEIVDEFRSRSTSELSIVEDVTRRRSGSTIMHPGLSVSHDSVFHSPNSGSDIEYDAAQSSSSLSIRQPPLDLRNELSERLRLRQRRGDTSEDDEGLPHSPCNSPTTTETLLDNKTVLKDVPTKSHSTCSDASLLSSGSFEMDEESYSHSSKQSLLDKPSSDSDLELAPTSISAPLNHSAAHHRVSVRPNKRRAPHRNKKPQLSNALPTTPEVNEDTSMRSVSPENIIKETITTRYTSATTITETTRLKCSSLPLGVAPPVEQTIDDDEATTKLNRSHSNATEKQDTEDEDRSSFFDRFFPRRSAKKRRSSAATRQRVEPIELPAEEIAEPIVKSPVVSPLQMELESRFKRMNDDKSPVIQKDEEKIRSKLKMPNLSVLQQRALNMNDELDDSGFKSLPDDIEKTLDTKNEEVIENCETYDLVQEIFNDVTISGPRHTAVVNISTSNKETISVTKIEVKRESGKLPEFLSKPLNKVENKASNVVLTIKSPKIIEDQNHLRKFSQEDIEIIETTPPLFKKNENRRKSSSSRSISLDSLKSSSEDSLDKIEEDEPKEKTIIVESVILRKKSQIRKSDDEQPELMKVFARRSLKLKDTDVDAVNKQLTVEVADNESKSSDKENLEESPTEDRKFVEVAEVTLRKPVVTRPFTLPAKEKDEKSRNLTDDLVERKSEIIESISAKSFVSDAVLVERKNFNQRKAEWEKRAQAASKKSVP